MVCSLVGRVPVGASAGRTPTGTRAAARGAGRRSRGGIVAAEPDLPRGAPACSCSFTPLPACAALAVGRRAGAPWCPWKLRGLGDLPPSPPGRPPSPRSGAESRWASDVDRYVDLDRDDFGTTWRTSGSSSGACGCSNGSRSRACSPWRGARCRSRACWRAGSAHFSPLKGTPDAVDGRERQLLPTVDACLSGVLSARRCDPAARAGVARRVSGGPARRAGAHAAARVAARESRAWRCWSSRRASRSSSSRRSTPTRSRSTAILTPVDARDRRGCRGRRRERGRWPGARRDFGSTKVF